MRGKIKQRYDPETDVLEKINQLKGWKIVGRELTKAFHLKDFSDAVSFINKVAVIANQMDHHPDILLSEFRTIRLFIKTNEFGKVTMRDVIFAEKVEKMIKRISK